MGYLYGTAFAVFYAVLGIPLGRLADVWDRRRLIALSLAFWSAMTALSGLARSFPQLALARIGVGAGEAGASPAAYSLLADYFPRARRATALAVYSSGIYLGMGLGLGIGGLIVDRWDAAWAGAPPFGLRGWQVAFFAAGLPGVFLSLWVRTLREPLRGAGEGLPSPAHAHPFREFYRELRAVVPPFTLLGLSALGADRRTIAGNLGGALALAGAAALLTQALGNGVQWVSLAAGGYAALSWAQFLALRDPPAFALIFGTPSLRNASMAFGLMSFTGYGYGFWTAPYLIRVLGADVARTGLVLGAIAAAGGWLGVTFGGVLADHLRQRSPRGRLYVGMLTAVLPIPCAAAMLATDRLELAYALNVPIFFFTAMWLGPGTSTVQDLVLPRMRATASAAFLLVVTFVGLALGPYTIGRVSVATGSLRTGLAVSLLANVAALVFAVRAACTIGADEDTRLARARAAGEPG